MNSADVMVLPDPNNGTLLLLVFFVIVLACCSVVGFMVLYVRAMRFQAVVAGAFSETRYLEFMVHHNGSKTVGLHRMELDNLLLAILRRLQDPKSDKSIMLSEDDEEAQKTESVLDILLGNSPQVVVDKLVDVE